MTSKVILCIDFFQKTIENTKANNEEVGKYNYMIHNILQMSDLVYVNGKMLTTDEFRSLT